MNETDFKNPYRPLEEIVLFRPMSEMIARWLKDSKLTPNTVSAIGFLCSLIAAYFIAHTDGSVMSRVFVIFMLYLTFLFDKVDGDLARIKRMASPYGTYFDSFLDRVGEIALFAAILLSGVTAPPLLVGITFAAPLLFYYHQVAVEAYIVRPTYANSRALSFYLKDLISYNRVKHIILLMILVAAGATDLAFYLFPFVFLLPLAIFLKKSVIHSLRQ
jgi:phosphatidylglycerophosphate synthase